MKNEFIIQVKKMQKLEHTYVVFGQGTKMPFITCDEESYNDQIWIFSTEEKAKEFAEKRKEENKDLLMVVKMENKQLLGFYSSLYLFGVNEIVFSEAEQVSKIPLEKLVVKPDYSKIPAEKQPLTNPQMQLTGLYFMQEVQRGIPNTEKPILRELEEEMAVNLVRSRFLLAVEVQGETRLPDGSNIRIPCVQNQDGKMFQPIFTDANELRKFNAEGKFQANLIEFANIDKVLGSNIEGIVINPQSMNIVILRSKIAGLLEQFTVG